MAELAVPRQMLWAILWRVHRLRLLAPVMSAVNRSQKKTDCFQLWTSHSSMSRSSLRLYM